MSADLKKMRDAIEEFKSVMDKTSAQDRKTLKEMKQELADFSPEEPKKEKPKAKPKAKPKKLPAPQKAKPPAKAKSTGGRTGKVAKKKAFGAGSTKAQRNQHRLAIKSKTDGVKVKAVKAKPKVSALKMAKGAGLGLASTLAMGISAAKDVRDENKAQREKHKKLRKDAKSRKDKSLKLVSGTGNIAQQQRKTRKQHRATVRTEKIRRKHASKSDPKKALTLAPKKTEAKKENAKPSPKPAPKKQSVNTPAPKSTPKAKPKTSKLPAAGHLRKKFNELNAYKGTFADYKREHYAKRKKK